MVCCGDHCHGGGGRGGSQRAEVNCNVVVIRPRPTLIRGH